MKGLAFLVFADEDVSEGTPEEEEAAMREALRHVTFTKTKRGITTMKFEIYDREDGKIGVRLEGGNGEVMFGTQGYASDGNARRAIKRIKDGIKAAPIVRIKEKARAT